MDRAFRLPLEHDSLQNKKENGITLVVTYNPANIIKQIPKTIEEMKKYSMNQHSSMKFTPVWLQTKIKVQPC